MAERSTNVQRPLLQAVEAIASSQDSIRLWEPWIIFILSELEQHAEEYDFYHPTAYEAMLQELRDHIDLRLRLGNW
jgi:hypothetical protein